LWAFVDKLPPHFVFLAPDGEVQHVNRAILTYYGRTLEDLKGWTQSDALHPDDRDRVVGTWAAAIAAGGGETFDITHRARRHDGVYRWMNAQMFPYWGEDGRLVRWISLNTDVDDLKRAQTLLEGEVRVLEMLGLGGRLEDVLETLCKVVGEVTDDCIANVLVRRPDGQALWVGGAPELEALEANPPEVERVNAAQNPAGAVVGEKTVVHYDLVDDPRWALSAWAALARRQGLAACWRMPLLSGASQTLGLLAIYRRGNGSPTESELEFTARFATIAGIAIARAQADAALADSEAELRRAHGVLADAQKLSKTGSFTWDTRNRQVWSDEAYRIFGLEPGTTLTAAQYHEFVHPEDRHLHDAMVERGLANLDIDAIYRIVTPQGEVRHVHTIAHRLEEVTDRTVYLGAVQDVSEAKAAEAALKASEAELRQAYSFLAEAQKLSKTGSFTWDAPDKQVWSDEAYRVLGLEPGTILTNELARDLVHPEDRHLHEAMIESASAGAEMDAHYRIVTPGGLVKHVHTIAHRLEDVTDRAVYLGAVQDVSEAKAAEEALSKARADLARVSRAMALGALTASIAHEVNQPLAGIVANAATCQRMLAAHPPNVEGARATAERMIRDGNRAADVVQRLRGLFANKPPTLGSVDLNEAAAEVLALSSAELQSARVSVSTRFADGLPTIRGDRVQVQQVILNLVLNAADAMRDVDDRVRELTVSTTLDADACIRLSVRDVGLGIDPDNVERLFEAFHTTKASGMGVGLAVSRSIVESHEGRLWAEPNEGPGATFAFAIPAHPGPEGRLGQALAGRRGRGPAGLSAPSPRSS
jgi:PAS domain S-box-containing protein